MAWMHWLATLTSCNDHTIETDENDNRRKNGQDKIARVPRRQSPLHLSPHLPAPSRCIPYSTSSRRSTRPIPAHQLTHGAKNSTKAKFSDKTSDWKLDDVRSTTSD